MRTVTFSNPEVQRLLNQSFVNTFSNTQGDPSAGMSIKHAPRDPAGSCIRGNGKQNVQTIFLTPKGEIFHVATGFLAPEDLLTESRFALDLYQSMTKENRDQPSSEIVVERHRERLKQLGFEDREINSNSGMPPHLFAQLGDKRAGLQFGSQSRNSGSLGAPGDMFTNMIKSQFLEDNKFSMKYPLMSQQDLERDPTRLVGNGKSFFASSSSGN